MAGVFVVSGVCAMSFIDRVVASDPAVDRQRFDHRSALMLVLVLLHVVMIPPRGIKASHSRVTFGPGAATRRPSR